MQRFVQTLDLYDDAELIAQYVDVHRTDRIWPEITAGIKQVGITAMDIYRLGTRLVMIVELPDDVDFDSAMATLATLPRQQEWEEHVAQYQRCAPGSTSAGKWQRMEQFFALP